MNINVAFVIIHLVWLASLAGPILVIDTPPCENLYKKDFYVITILSLPHINKTTGKLCVCLYSYHQKTCTLLRSTMQQPTQNIIATIDFVGLRPKNGLFAPRPAPFDTTETSVRLPHNPVHPAPLNGFQDFSIEQF